MPAPNPIYKDRKLFESVAKEIHGDLYDYSKSELKGSTNKIKIICKECGNEFMCSPWDHLYGKRGGGGRGCPHCANKRRSETLTKDKEWFMSELKKRREDRGEFYDYSKLIYKSSTDNAEFICPIHGPFWQTPWSHLCGSGCPKCGMEKTLAGRRDDWDSYFEKMKAQRADKCSVYDYSKVIYKGCYEPIEIICPKHGSFWQRPSVHAYSDAGCPMCKASHLEVKTRLVLEELGVRYEYQKRFDWLGNQSLDFYLPDYKIGIECQGVQHYKEVPYFSTRTLEEQKKADISKYNKCHYRGIHVRYIHYKEEHIKERVMEIINKSK